MPEEIQKERYSFSKLSSFHTCPYGYKLSYIDHQERIGNAFSSYGTLVHSILERYSKHELGLEDLVDTFEWEYASAVPEAFPYNKYVDLEESYKSQAIDFLFSFTGYQNYKILGVEKNFDLEIDDWIFNGIIDLVFEDENGRLIIRDYKSKASFKNKTEQKTYARQLYLYSLHIKEQYGRYPDELQFLMFRKQNLVTIPFDESALEEAVKWAKQTVKDIRNCIDFEPICEDFYSHNLCNHRNNCDLRIT